MPGGGDSSVLRCAVV